jgi:hypothetical protein
VEAHSLNVLIAFNGLKEKLLGNGDAGHSYAGDIRNCHLEQQV